MEEIMFKGAIVAQVTPFKGEDIDWEAFDALIERQIDAGIDGIVPCGTTGEAATMAPEEREQVIERTVRIVSGRIPVIAGAGTNDTSDVLRFVRFAQGAGADGVLVVTPYYNKPTQQGMYEHYKKVIEASEVPVVLYNVPSRTGINLLPETVARLAEFDRVVGIKEASGSVDQASEIVRLCGDRIGLLSGDDSLTLPLLAIGAVGVISAVANLVPADIKALCHAWESSDPVEARRLHYRLLPIFKTLFIETNPIPVKTALGIKGLIDPEFRLPLVPMSSENAAILRAAMEEYGLIDRRAL